MAASSYYSTVQKAYIAFYGRPADPSGLTYWATRIDAAGGNISSIIQAFGTSAEANSLYGSLTNEAAVQALYNQIFGREPDLSGLNFYVNKLTAGTYTLVDVAQRIIDGATGDDATLVANKLTAAQSFTDGLDSVAEVVGYSGDTAAGVARAWLDTVTSSTATVTAAQAALGATLTTISTTGGSATSYDLTSAADLISGTAGANTFNALGGTLSASDELDGGAGRDTLVARLTEGVGSVVLNNIEVVDLIARTAGASIDLSLATSVDTVTIEGSTNIAVSGLANGGSTTIKANTSDITLVAAATTATATNYTVNLSSANGADVIYSAGNETTADSLTLNMVGNWANGSSATHFSGVETLVIGGNGDANLNLASGVAGGLSADAFADLTAVNASSLTGALTLRLDSVDANIQGGAGNDVFILTANLNTNDTVDGNGGSDRIDAVLTGGYVRPIISDVETLNVLVNSTAATADFRDVSGVATVNLMLGTGLVVDKAGSSITTLNVNSSDSTANALTVQYGTAAVASDLTVNLGLATVGTLQTAVGTATTGMGIGTLTFSGNSGSLTIATNSTAKYTAAAIESKDFTAVTINANAASFVVDSAVDVGTAQTLTLNAAAGKTLTVGDDLSADSVTNLTVSAGQSATLTVAETASLDAATTVTIGAGASAVVDFSAIQLSEVSTLTINAEASSLVTADAIEFGAVGTTAGSGALAINNVAINAAGDVVIAALSGLCATTAVNLEFDLTVTNTAASIDIGGAVFKDVASGATAGEQSIRVVAAGTGTVVFSAGATASSNVTYSIDATQLASGSTLTINLAAINDTDSVASAVLGAASGTYNGVDGVDNVQVGLGAVTVDGLLGNDVITFGNSAANYAHMTIDTVAGTDTIIGAAAGDVILFGGANTATANAYLKSAWNTGTATTTAQFLTASFSAAATAAGFSAIKQVSVYTSNGDTIIQVLGTSSAFDVASSAPASGTDDYVTVVLSNKDFTAVTAAFKLDSTATGLSLTLL
jgi:hypothetical protein